ncbi:MAG: MBL fold metallo-hydrolase [Candidatus Methanomethylicia archaeon]
MVNSVSVNLIVPGFSTSSPLASAYVFGLASQILVRSDKYILFDVGHLPTRRMLIEGLRRLELNPKLIDCIVLSHLHGDHVLNIDLFRDSEVIVGDAEFIYAKSPRDDDLATPRFITDILEEMDLRRVSNGYKVAENVVVMEVPGHTAGSLSLVIDLPIGRAILAGDALTNIQCIKLGRPLLVFWDEKQATESLKRIVEAGDILYPGHGIPARRINGDWKYIGSVNVDFSFFPYGFDRDFNMHIHYNVQY